MAPHPKDGRTAQERYRDKRTTEWQRRTTYSIWYMMIRRCYEPLHDAYFDYGGRGICVQETWLYSPFSTDPRTKKEAFANFLNDIGLRPSQYYSLDRIDADGHYEVTNLRWASRKVQARNKRASLFVPDPQDPGVMIPVAELADRLHMSYQQLRDKLQRAGVWPGDINTEVK